MNVIQADALNSGMRTTANVNEPRGFTGEGAVRKNSRELDRRNNGPNVEHPTQYRIHRTKVRDPFTTLRNGHPIATIHSSW
jgi:hypothetical protein